MRSLFQTLRLEQLVLLTEHAQSLLQFAFDGFESAGQLFLVGNKVLGRKDLDTGWFVQDFAGQRVDFGDTLDLIAPELDAQSGFAVGRKDVHRVASDAETAAMKVSVVALVKDLGEVAQNTLASMGLAFCQLHHVLAVLFRRANVVDTRHARHDDGVTSAEERRGGRQAQAIYLFIDVGILLDVGVGLREIGLWLIVVVVAHKVLDRIVGKELAKLAVELGGQGLVVRQHQCWALNLGDDVRCHIGLARAGHPEQCLVFVSFLQTLDQPSDGIGLISRWSEVGNELKVGHLCLPLEVSRQWTIADDHYTRFGLTRCNACSILSADSHPSHREVR